MTVQYSLPTQARIDGVVVGVLLDLPQASAPWVTYPGCPSNRASPPAAPPCSPLKTSAAKWR